MNQKVIEQMRQEMIRTVNKYFDNLLERVEKQLLKKPNKSVQATPPPCEAKPVSSPDSSQPSGPTKSPEEPPPSVSPSDPELLQFFAMLEQRESDRS